MDYCLYYQALVTPSQCWFLVGVLRSFEHMVFDRTLDKSQSLFEFFVPAGQEQSFLELMQFFSEHGVIRDLRKLNNRLLDPAQKL